MHQVRILQVRFLCTKFVNVTDVYQYGQFRHTPIIVQRYTYSLTIPKACQDGKDTKVHWSHK